MKKIAIAGFLLGLFGYVTARLFGKPRPKQISDRGSAAS
jgi:VIT1/CCC1 family predicted Fe2+/Mn2+ transporter